eukprot:1098770-Amorphochlora_amoeboformis.AAC.1
MVTLVLALSDFRVPLRVVVRLGMQCVKARSQGSVKTYCLDFASRHILWIPRQGIIYVSRLEKAYSVVKAYSMSGLDAKAFSVVKAYSMDCG